MKKHLRILAAVLVLCFSLSVPCGICRQCTDCGLQAVHCSRSDLSAGKKTEQMVWVPTHGGKKYHSKSTCSNMKDPEKVTLSKAKAEGFTACKKCY